MPESRTRMLQREFQIIGLLFERPRRLEELASLCGVHHRTIRRDLAALASCGCVLVREEDSGRWRLRGAPKWLGSPATQEETT